MYFVFATIHNYVPYRAYLNAIVAIDYSGDDKEIDRWLDRWAESA